MDWSDEKEGLSAEKKMTEVKTPISEPYLNPAQLNKFAGIFQKEILPVMKAHEEAVEKNPELKMHIEKAEKRKEVRLIFRHMMAEVEDAIEKPGTPFAENLKQYIGELEEIVTPSSTGISEIRSRKGQ